MISIVQQRQRVCAENEMISPFFQAHGLSRHEQRNPTLTMSKYNATYGILNSAAGTVGLSR